MQTGVRPRSGPNHRRTVVFGIGNTLRGDDGIGPRVIEGLRGRVANEVSLIPCQQLLPEHAAELACADRVIFLDASTTTRPGSVACRRLFPGAGGEAGDPHHLTPHTIIGAARDWFGVSPQAILVTIGVTDWTAGEALSPVLADALPQIVDLVAELASEESAFRPGALPSSGPLVL
ncbi:MAG TPA: hydrogenase maturation protease [Terriglobales bacterium]|nr:hydrogenase maturation protease [Terriglobales bacterium]